MSVARAFGGEIVNFDSVQVYRGLDIGSAKVPAADRHQIRHHLIDILEPDQELTAGAYARLAREAVSSIGLEGCLPILVGGTGFYLRALLDGLSPAPTRDRNFRSRLNRIAGRHPHALHRFLRKHDPRAAARIHPNDHQKLIRAIEITCATREPASAIQNLPREAFQGVIAFKIGLNPERTALYKHLDERSAWMFHNGLLEETETLLKGGVPVHAKPLQSLGYRQALQVLTERLPMDEAILDCQRKTRQYAKRQLTWFRKEAGVHWLAGFGTGEAVRNAAHELTGKFLASLDNF